MVFHAFDETRWLRPEPRRTLPSPILERIVHLAFPGHGVVESELLGGGLRNANFKLRLDSKSDLIVLRIYEHDASLCQKEIDLMHLIRDLIPVPEVIYAEPQGFENFPPFVLLQYVEGISFRELKRGCDRDAIGQAARSAGETLAAIGRITFSESGWLGPGPTVAASLLEGPDVIPQFVDLCLASSNLQGRMAVELCNRTHALVWSCAPRLALLENKAHLVHGDFNKRNLLVRCIQGRWCISAVLDWEFAISGSPLNDVGNFLRYERAEEPLVEPHFSTGYVQAGGTLPDDWRRQARWVDLTAICEILTRDHLPDAVIKELVELVRATVEDRDPIIA